MRELGHIKAKNAQIKKVATEQVVAFLLSIINRLMLVSVDQKLNRVVC